MACTVTLPSSSLLPYNIPPRLMENARADCTYDWNMLAACLSKDTDAQCGSSCLCKPKPRNQLVGIQKISQRSSLAYDSKKNYALGQFRVSTLMRLLSL